MIAPIRVASVFAAAVGIATSAGLAVAAPASASTVAHGKVVAAGGLVIRSAPSRYSEQVTTFANGTRVNLICKLRGTTVAGNSIWYLNAGEGTAWMPARYVSNLGAAPHWCNGGDLRVGKARVGTNIRSGPTTSDTVVGHYSAGASVRVVCQSDGQHVGSSSLWYYTTSGHWVVASNVRLPHSPRYCAY